MGILKRNKAHLSLTESKHTSSPLLATANDNVYHNHLCTVDEVNTYLQKVHDTHYNLSIVFNEDETAWHYILIKPGFLLKTAISISCLIFLNDWHLL